MKRKLRRCSSFYTHSQVRDRKIACDTSEFWNYPGKTRTQQMYASMNQGLRRDLDIPLFIRWVLPVMFIAYLLTHK